MVRKIGTHTEVVIVKPQKKKTTCIYLDDNRICRCKQSARYTEKCFEATSCTYKVKGKHETRTKKRNSRSGKPKVIILNDEQKLLKAQLCEVGKTICHNKFGKGKVISYKDNQIVILFNEEEKKLDLDTVVYKGYLNLSE